jgi:hypothetical protein
VAVARFGSAVLDRVDDRITYGWFPPVTVLPDGPGE